MTHVLGQSTVELVLKCRSDRLVKMRYRLLLHTLNGTQAPSVTFGATSLSEGGLDIPAGISSILGRFHHVAISPDSVGFHQLTAPLSFCINFINIYVK